MEDSSELKLECLVCFEDKKIDSITFLPCIHFICSTCHDKLVKNECPFCRNILKEEKEDSFSETENEHVDVQFEILITDRESRNKKKKSKKHNKKLLKVVNENREMIISIERNTYRILDTLENHNP